MGIIFCARDSSRKNKMFMTTFEKNSFIESHRENFIFLFNDVEKKSVVYMKTLYRYKTNFVRQR